MENQNRNSDNANNAGSDNSTEARNTLTELALVLHQCGDGSMVTNPRDCREGTFNNTGLPNLELA